MGLLKFETCFIWVFVGGEDVRGTVFGDNIFLGGAYKKYVREPKVAKR